MYGSDIGRVEVNVIDLPLGILFQIVQHLTHKKNNA